MNIRVVCVGALKEVFWSSAISEYTKRIGKYAKIEIVEIKESGPQPEATEIRRHIRGHAILMDIGGVSVTSPELATIIRDTQMTASTITFIVGGSNGVGTHLDDVVDRKISFGRVTLPHQLFRVVLVEQIYRAFSIIAGEKYHK